MHASKAGPLIDVRRVFKYYRIWRDPQARFKSILLSLVLRGFHLLRISWLRALNHKLEKHIQSLHRDFFALQDVSLQLSGGETVGIIGLNGSGKSTLLQIIAGVLQPSAGDICVNGRVAALLELGAGFNEEFTGRENVFLNAAIWGLEKPQIEERMEEIIKFSEIGEFIDQPVKTYSSGMKVRLAFSVLTQIKPDIFIIDEALSVGDAYFSHKSTSFIREYVRDGGTLLLCSHDLNAVKTLCHRAILLESGRIVEEGDCERVVDYFNAIISKRKDDFKIRQYKNTSGKYVTRSGSGEVVIDAFRILDEERNETINFHRGERLIVKIKCTAKKAVDQLTAGIKICDRIGSTVFGVNSFHLEEDIRNVKRGEQLEFDFFIDLNLVPGEYSITAAIHSDDSHLKGNYDWIENMSVVRINGRKTDHFTIGTAYLNSRVTVDRTI